MPSWLVLFAIILVCLTVLLFMKRSNSEGFGDFKDIQMSFANKQYTYFHDKADKGIFTNPGLNLYGLNDAMTQPDLYLAKSPDRDYTSYFVEDVESAYSAKDEAFCKRASTPRDLPRREAASKVACGWYYVGNSAVPSVGALGTRDGPIFSDGLPANGEWIWDIPTAIMKEDIKACKRVKSCELMSVEGIRGKCGFCERLGHAVPINHDGSEKYPESEEGSCGQYTVKEASACFKETPTPVITDDGINCGTYGYPSPDNSKRLYTKAECDALNGNFSANGECLIKKGGSYSWSCRTLNNPMPDRVNAPVNICAPSVTGRLSRDCLQSLATGLGYSKSGAVLRLLSTGSAPGDTDRLAIEQLKSAGYSVPNAIIGSGDIDSQSAANLYQKLYEAMARGTTTIARQAAQWMVTGTDKFDVCAIDANSTGPFPTACLQRAFRMAGCQASGEKNPSEKTAGIYANMTWGDVNSEFTKLYDSMKSSVSTEQDKGVKDCLGFAYARPPPPRCDYKQTIGGYDETSGVGQICFTTTLKNAKDTCAGMPNCRSFSFENKPNLSDTTTGFGCYKMDKTGFTQSGQYTGFTKLDQPLNDYQYKGCYNDSPNRALPVYVGNGKDVESCKTEAKKRNMNTFGLQYNGECWLGNDVEYAKYGPTNSCGNLGGAWSQNIYKKAGVDMVDFSASPLIFNGRVKPSIIGKELKLITHNVGAVSASAFMLDKQPITNFYTSFTVRFANNRADGMTFCIQNQSVNAVGGNGGSLGLQGINPGVAIRLDNYYGPTGRLSVGFIPATTAISNTGSGFQDLAESGDITQLMGLSGGDNWVLNVEIKYSNNTLTYIVSNASNPELSYGASIGNVDLPRLVGGKTAWMGFTAGTGGATSDIFVSNWKISDTTLPEKWVRIGSDSNPSVSVGNNTQVRYGRGDRWMTRTMSGAFVGNPTTFGGDPSPGVMKEIQAFL